jgi:ubiquinone biosynthesis protein
VSARTFVSKVCARPLVHAAQFYGGGVLKTAQICATRHDIFPAAFTKELSRLQDRVTPTPFCRHLRLQAYLESHGWPGSGTFVRFDERPIAAGSVAQIHRAVVAPTRCVVVKVLRPNVAARFARDARILRAIARIAGRVDSLRRISLERALLNVSRCVQAQTDLSVEAAAQVVSAQLLEQMGVSVPAVLTGLSQADVLVMDYVQDFTRLDRAGKAAKQALLAITRGLFKLLFCDGVVHCDLHPGNIGVSGDGRPTLLDFGFVDQLNERERCQFGELFFGIAVGDTATVAETILGTSMYIPDDFDRRAFCKTLDRITAQYSGRSAREFSIIQFVRALFAVQRQYGIRPSESFTMAILSLLVLEGTVRLIMPEMEFQREALPYVLRVV